MSVTADDKDRLIDAEVTLNGQPAKVAGRKLAFPSVVNVATGEHYQWSWEAVAHIVADRDGRFVS